MQPRQHEDTKKHTENRRGRRDRRERSSLRALRSPRLGFRDCVSKSAVVAIMLLSVACQPADSKSTTSGQPARSALTIAVIPKGTSHVFWQSIHAGANRAAQELGVTVIWRGPL